MRGGKKDALAVIPIILAVIRTDPDFDSGPPRTAVGSEATPDRAPGVLDAALHAGVDHVLVEHHPADHPRVGVLAPGHLLHLGVPGGTRRGNTAGNFHSKCIVCKEKKIGEMLE